MLTPLPPLGKSTIGVILEQILGARFPKPGQSIQFPVVSWRTPGQIDTLIFTRPDDDDSLFDYVREPSYRNSYSALPFRVLKNLICLSCSSLLILSFCCSFCFSCAGGFFASAANDGPYFDPEHFCILAARAVWHLFLSALLLLLFLLTACHSGARSSCLRS
jgi:hypothetical protein